MRFERLCWAWRGRLRGKFIVPHGTPFSEIVAAVRGAGFEWFVLEDETGKRLTKLDIETKLNKGDIVVRRRNSGGYGLETGIFGIRREERSGIIGIILMIVMTIILAAVILFMVF